MKNDTTPTVKHHVTRFAAITTVTFDVGGTLLRPHPSVGAVYAAVARRHGIDADAAGLERAFRGAIASVSIDKLQAGAETRERDFWRQIVRATFAHVPLPPPQSDLVFEELWESFARGDCWRLLPGARATVETLRSRGYRLAVLSNWDERLHRVLAETGLVPLFDRVLVSSEVGAEKPDVAIFRAAERALASAPGQCLHIGDSRTHDLAGAHAAGWSALLVDGDEAVPKSEHVIGHLADLTALLPIRA